MALVKAKTFVEERPVTYDDAVAEKIQRRRYQILVHSLLYYELDINLVSDAQWAEWGKELAQLQTTYPDIASRVIFDQAFKGFDGSTGFHLPFRDAQVVNIAYRLLKREKSAESADALYKLQYGIQRTPAEYDKYKQRSHSVQANAPTKKEVSPVEQKQRKGLFSVARK
jgi:hypothetical protein